MIIRAVLLTMSFVSPAGDEPIIGEPAFSQVEYAEVGQPAERSGEFIADVAVDVPPVAP